MLSIPVRSHIFVVISHSMKFNVPYLFIIWTSMAPVPYVVLCVSLFGMRSFGVPLFGVRQWEI
jgi:hypothetical protein